MSRDASLVEGLVTDWQIVREGFCDCRWAGRLVEDCYGRLVEDIWHGSVDWHSVVDLHCIGLIGKRLTPIGNRIGDAVARVMFDWHQSGSVAAQNRPLSIQFGRSQ